MFDRLERSWQLVKFSGRVLKQDKELMVFPVLSSIAGILVLASFLPLIMGTATTISTESLEQGQEQLNWVVLFFMYVIEYFVVFFFNAALVGAALERIHGGDPTVSSGLKIAFSRIGAIFGYAVIAATVGTALRFIGERVGFIGKIVVGLSGALWSLATFMVVPVLVSRSIGPVDALKDSLNLMKRTWGENIIANAGLGVFFGIIYFLGMILMLTFVGLGAGFSGEAAIGLFAVFAIFFLMIGVVHATMQGIFSAALYHYAVGGEDDAGIPADVLGVAFSEK